MREDTVPTVSLLPCLWSGLGKNATESFGIGGMLTCVVAPPLSGLGCSIVLTG